jgi:hypothetical protein
MHYNGTEKNTNIQYQYLHAHDKMMDVTAYVNNDYVSITISMTKENTSFVIFSFQLCSCYKHNTKADITQVAYNIVLASN